MNLLNGLRFLSGAFTGLLSWTPTANRTIVLPDDSGTVLLDDRPIGSLNTGVSVRGYTPIVSVSAPKTLALSDSNTYQLCTAASTITIPLNSAVAFPIGTEIIIQRNTSTAVAIAVIGGVSAVDEFGATISLTAVSNATLIKKTATDTWIVSNPIPNSAFLPGTPTTTTQPVGTNSIAIATTAYVKNEIATSGNLLVYATQDTAIPLTTSTQTLAPFPTQPLSVSPLFSAGVFTPTTSSLYRISCSLFFSGSVTECRVTIYQGATGVGIICLNNPPNTQVIVSGFTVVPLITGQAYCLRVQAIGSGLSIGIGSNVKNFLTIERLG